MARPESCSRTSPCNFVSSAKSSLTATIFAAVPINRREIGHDGRAKSNRPLLQSNTRTVAIADEPIVAREHPGIRAGCLDRLDSMPRHIGRNEMARDHRQIRRRDDASVEAGNRRRDVEARDDGLQPARRPAADDGKFHARVAQRPDSLDRPRQRPTCRSGPKCRPRRTPRRQCFQEAECRRVMASSHGDPAAAIAAHRAPKARRLRPDLPIRRHNSTADRFVRRTTIPATAGRYASPLRSPRRA